MQTSRTKQIYLSFAAIFDMEQFQRVVRESLTANYELTDQDVIETRGSMKVYSLEEHLEKIRTRGRIFYTSVEEIAKGFLARTDPYFRPGVKELIQKYTTGDNKLALCMQGDRNFLVDVVKATEFGKLIKGFWFLKDGMSPADVLKLSVDPKATKRVATFFIADDHTQLLQIQKYAPYVTLVHLHSGPDPAPEGPWHTLRDVKEISPWIESVSAIQVAH